VPSVYTAIEPAATLDSVRGALRQYDPQVALVSGHAFMGRLVFELPNGAIDLPSAAELLDTLQPDGVPGRLRCVVLNGCDTFEIGVGLVQAMPTISVLCWSSLAEDGAARAFARGFYDAIGTFLLARAPIDVELAYVAGFESFAESGYVYGDPTPYLHPPSHPHHLKPAFASCDGCTPPVHGRPVLVWSEGVELYMREGAAAGYPLALVDMPAAIMAAKSPPRSMPAGVAQCSACDAEAMHSTV